MTFPTVTEKQGTFGGGKHPLVDVRIKVVNFLIPEGHDVINGQLYRMIYDWESLQAITYPDGSHPTSCAMVPVDWPTTGDRPVTK